MAPEPQAVSGNELEAEITACKGCSGWEKWGKVPKKNDVISSSNKVSGAAATSSNGWEKWGKAPKQNEVVTAKSTTQDSGELAANGWEKWRKVPKQFEAAEAVNMSGSDAEGDASNGWEKWGKVPNQSEVSAAGQAADEAEEEDATGEDVTSTGWEKWGKVPKLTMQVACKEDCVSEAPTAHTASPRTEATGTPRKDECSSEVPSADLTSAHSSPRESPSFTPQMTPRDVPKAANSALAKPQQNNARRRSSRVSFMQAIGLDDNTDDEATGFAEIVQESLSLAPAPASPRVEKEGEGVSAVALAEDESDSDSDSDDDDIYDEYDFDHTKIAEMLQAGADREKLTSAIEDAMAAALERKLKEKTAASAPAEAEPSVQADVAGQMTPGRMTPTEGDTPNDGPDSETVAQHMQQAIESAQMRRRRSSAAKKPVAAIAEARKMAAEKRRASLAARMGSGPGGENEQESILNSAAQALQSAQRRHRKSICKASEVLGDVGYGDSTKIEEVTAQMSMIEVAMEEARRRHRRSIARAVQQLEEAPAGSALNADAAVFDPSVSSTPSATTQPSTSSLNASATIFVPPADTSCSGATNAGMSNTWEQQGSWGMQPAMQQSWNTAPSPFQDRISTAISSAYQTHCYNEQQSYQEYDNSGYKHGSMWQCNGAQSYGGDQFMQGSCQGVQYTQQGCMAQGGMIQQTQCMQPVQMQQTLTCMQPAPQNPNAWQDQGTNSGYYCVGETFEGYPNTGAAQCGASPMCAQGTSWQANGGAFNGGADMTMCSGYSNYMCS